jgi:hypothetical protein
VGASTTQRFEMFSYVVHLMSRSRGYDSYRRFRRSGRKIVQIPPRLVAGGCAGSSAGWSSPRCFVV